MKNEIEQLRDAVAAAAPTARLVLRAPRKQANAWWLEAQLDDLHVTTEWKPSLEGFGITAPAEGIGEGADEVFDDVPSAAARIVALLREHGNTKAPAEMALDELRRHREITQQQLAEALDVRQASISKTMHRPNADFQVSTLQKVIRAMGGRLKLVAEFPDAPSVEIVDATKAP